MARAQPKVGGGPHLLRIAYYVLRINSFMILICVDHANLRYLRAISLGTVLIDHFRSINRYNV